jgi:DNA-binding MarR family transcriptional regulator
VSARPGLATGFASAEESPGLLLWRVTNRWQAAQRATLKPFDLTHVQFVLLAALTWLGHDGPITQRSLAGHAGTDPMMTSQVVRVLERRQLVVRTPHATDGRAWSVSATDAGVALANRAVVAVEACDEAFFGPLGPARGPFTRALATLGGPDPSA